MKIVSTICLLLLVCTAASADFSYSFKLGAHSLIVTGLGNGKSFVSFDGHLFTPRPGTPRSISANPLPNWHFATTTCGRYLFIWTSADTKLVINVLPTCEPRQTFINRSTVTEKLGLRVEFMGVKSQLPRILKSLRRRSTQSCYA